LVLKAWIEDWRRTTKPCEDFDEKEIMVKPNFNPAGHGSKSYWADLF